MRQTLKLIVFTAVFSTLALAQPAPAGALPSLAPLVDSVKGAVVNVDVVKRGNDEAARIMERFSRGGQEAPLASGTGSGFVIDPRGLVVTNNHVIDGAVSMRVRFDDARSYEAELVGRDPLTDVAIIKLKGKVDALPSVKLGDSSTVRVGDWAVAIGNPFGLGHSVSAGIISALDRQIGLGPGMGRYDQFLQTDAAINPGNSGGPLFNLKGEVIGINSAIVGAATGIGFAVPSNLVKALVPQLEKDGYVTRGWLGVGIQDVTPGLAKALSVPQAEGALVGSVNEGSPAAKGGLKEDDVILSIDGQKISSSTALTRTIALKKPDTVVTVSVSRAGKPVELKVKVGVRPDLENIGTLEAPAEDKGDKHKVGLAFQEVDPRFAEATGVARQGAMIIDVSPTSPADKAGFRRGMVVTEFNKKPIRSRDDLFASLKDAKSGATVLVRISVPGGSRTLLALEIP